MGEPDPVIVALHHLRLARGLSQERLARDAGVSLKALSSWELGYRSPMLMTLRLVVDALDADLTLTNLQR